jgi:hypothetical protein
MNWTEKEVLTASKTAGKVSAVLAASGVSGGNSKFAHFIAI